MNDRSSVRVYTLFNGLGVAVAYFMLALSLWFAPVDLSAKGYWGMGIFMLTLALVNFVKYRMEDRQQSDRIAQIEAAKNERLLAEYVSEK